MELIKCFHELACIYAAFGPLPLSVCLPSNSHMHVQYMKASKVTKLNYGKKWEFVHIAQCGGICDKMETLDITPT